MKYIITLLLFFSWYSSASELGVCEDQHLEGGISSWTLSSFYGDPPVARNKADVEYIEALVQLDYEHEEGRQPHGGIQERAEFRASLDFPSSVDPDNVELLAAIEKYKKVPTYSENIPQLFFLSAKKGSIPAQLCLARVYREGIGTPPDPIKAYAWIYAVNMQLRPWGGDLVAWWDHGMSYEEKTEAELLGDSFVRQYTDMWDEPSMVIVQ